MAARVVAGPFADDAPFSAPVSGGRIARAFGGGTPLAEVGAAGGAVDAPTERDITAARSGGKPLEGRIRRSMETGIGADFSNVRVHVDAQSDSLNQRIQAKAFTTGSHVFIRREHHRPDTTEGQRLLAHELVHTVQQGASPQLDTAQRAIDPIAHSVQRSSMVIQRWDWWEKRKAVKAEEAKREKAEKEGLAKNKGNVPTHASASSKLADPTMEQVKPGASIGAAAAAGVGAAIGKGAAHAGGAASATLGPLLLGDAAAGLYSSQQMKSEGAKYGDKGLGNLGGRKASDQGTQFASAALSTSKGGVDLANAAAKTTAEMGGTALGAAGAGLGIAGGSVMVMQGAWRGGHAVMKLCRLTWGRAATMITQKGEEWKRHTLRAEKFKAAVNGLKVAVGVLGIAAGALLIVSNPIGWAIGLAAAIAGGVYAISKIAGKISNAKDQDAARRKIESGVAAEQADDGVIRLSVKGKAREKKGAGFTTEKADVQPDDPKRAAAIAHANEVAKQACSNARIADEMRDALGHGDKGLVTKALETKVEDEEFEPAKSLREIDDQQLYDAFQILSSINVSFEEALSDSGQLLIQKKLSKADAM